MSLLTSVLQCVYIWLVEKKQRRLCMRAAGAMTHQTLCIKVLFSWGMNGLIPVFLILGEGCVCRWLNYDCRLMQIGGAADLVLHCGSSSNPFKMSVFAWCVEVFLKRELSNLWGAHTYGKHRLHVALGFRVKCWFLLGMNMNMII